MKNKTLKKKLIIGLFLIVFVLSSLLFLSNNVFGVQDDENIEVTISGELNTDSSELYSSLMPTGTYSFFEQPELDLGLSDHDSTRIDVSELQQSASNTTSNSFGNTTIPTNLQYNHTTKQIPQYTISAPKDTIISTNINFNSTKFASDYPYYLNPNGDITTEWHTFGSPHYTQINDYPSTSPTNIIFADDTDDGQIEIFDFTSATIYENTTKIILSLHLDLYSDIGLSTDLKANLYDGLTWLGEKTFSYDTHIDVGFKTTEWIGLQFNQTKLNALRIKLTAPSSIPLGGYLIIHCLQINISGSGVYNPCTIPFCSLQVNNFKYQILGINYTQTFNMSYNPSYGNYVPYNETNIFISYYFSSSILTSYIPHTSDLLILSQNLSLTFLFWILGTFQFSANVSYSVNEWKVPSEVDLSINGNDVIDDSYNSGFVLLSIYPSSLVITSSSSNMFFKLNITVDFSFSFSLQIISKTYLKQDFELESNHEIELTEILFDNNLQIKKVYLNNVLKSHTGNHCYLTPNILMQTGNTFYLEIILDEEIYLPLQYIMNTLGSGTANIYLSGISNAITFNNINGNSLYSIPMPQNCKPYYANMSFSDIQYTPDYIPNYSNDLSGYGYTSPTGGDESVQFNGRSYYQLEQNGTKIGESPNSGYENIYSEYFNALNGYMTHTYGGLDGQNSTYTSNAYLYMQNLFPSNFTYETWLNFVLSYNSSYTTSSFANQLLSSRLLQKQQTNVPPTSWSFLNGTKISDGDLYTINNQYSTLKAQTTGASSVFSATLTPDGDTTTEWHYAPESGTHFSKVNDHPDYDFFQDYIIADPTDDAQTEQFTLGTSIISSNVTSLVFQFIYCRMSDVVSNDFKVDFYDGVKWLGQKTISTISGPFALYTGSETWTGLRIDQTRLNNLQVKLTAPATINSGMYIGFYINSFQVIGSGGTTTYQSCLNTSNTIQFSKQNNETIDYVKLYYSHKTNESATVNFYAYNFITSSWTLINSSDNSVVFANNYYSLSSSYYNSTYHVKIRYLCNAMSDGFLLYIDRLSIEVNRTKTSGFIYSSISKSFINQILNRYDVGFDSFQKLYGIILKFQYKYSNYSKYSEFAKFTYNGFVYALTKDEAWHSVVLNFEFNSTSNNYFAILFNITNGLLELKNFNYTMVFKCLLYTNYYGDPESFDNEDVSDAEVYYNSPDNFNDEPVGESGTDIAWVDLCVRGGVEVASVATIIAELDNHKNVLKLTDDGGADRFVVRHYFPTPQTAMTYEWWWGSDDVSKGSYFFFEGPGSNSVCLIIGNSKYYYLINGFVDVQEIVGAVPTNDILSHFKCVIDCTTDKFDLYINGVLRVNQGDFNTVGTSISQITCSSASVAAYSQYISAPSDVADPYYEQGDNYYGGNSVWDIDWVDSHSSTDSGQAFTIVDEEDEHKNCAKLTSAGANGKYAVWAHYFDPPLVSDIHEVWFKYEDLGQGSIQFRYYNQIGEYPIIFYVDGTTNLLNCYWNGYIITTTAITPDVWHRFKVSFSCLTDKYSLWLDDVLIIDDKDCVKTSTSIPGLEIVLYGGGGVNSIECYIDDWDSLSEVEGDNCIYQYFRYVPSFSLDYLQMIRGNFILNFTYSFTASSDIEHYRFYNSIDYSLLYFRIYVKADGVWLTPLIYKYNTTQTNVDFTLNITLYLNGLGYFEFNDFYLEFYIAGNPSNLTLDNLILYDFDNDFYLVQELWIDDVIANKWQDITIYFKASDEYIDTVEIRDLYLSTITLITTIALTNNTLQSFTFQNEEVGFHVWNFTFLDSQNNWELWTLNFTIANGISVLMSYKNPTIVFDTNTIRVNIFSDVAITKIWSDNSTNYKLEYNNISYPLYSYNFSFTVYYEVYTIYDISVKVMSEWGDLYWINVTNLYFIQQITILEFQNFYSRYYQDESFRTLIMLRNMYNQPIINQQIYYDIVDPLGVNIYNGASLTNASGVIVLQLDFDITYEIGFYHLNASYAGTTDYTGVWKLQSFDLFPTQRSSNSAGINLKVNGNSVIGNTIQIFNTNNLTITNYNTSIFDVSIVFKLNYTEAISYSESMPYSFTFYAISYITQLTLDCANLTSFPANFTDYYFNGLRTTNYQIVGSYFVINDLIGDVFRNTNSFNLGFYYLDSSSIQRTQITNNPRTDSDSVVFEETLMANRSFSYWYFINSYSVNSLSLLHERTATTINYADFEIVGSKYYLEESSLTSDLFTATVDYKPGYDISYTVTFDNGTNCFVEVTFKSSLDISNVTLLLDLSTENLYAENWMYGGLQSSISYILEVPHLNFTTSYQIITLTGVSGVPYCTISNTVNEDSFELSDEEHSPSEYFLAYLSFSKYSKSFIIYDIQDSWDLDGVHYFSNFYDIDDTGLFECSGFGSGISTSYLHFKTNPITSWEREEGYGYVRYKVKTDFNLEEIDFVFYIEDEKRYDKNDMKKNGITVENCEYDSLLTLITIEGKDYYQFLDFNAEEGEFEILIEYEYQDLGDYAFYLLLIGVVFLGFVGLYLSSRGKKVKFLEMLKFWKIKSEKNKDDDYVKKVKKEVSKNNKNNKEITKIIKK